MIRTSQQFYRSYSEDRQLMDDAGCIAVLVDYPNSVCSKSIGQLHLRHDGQLLECVIRVLVCFA